MSKILEKARVGKANDKRRKLTDRDKAVIRDLHGDGQSIHSLSREYQVSRRTIQFVVYPERLDRNKELREKRGGTKVYYDKDKHKEYTKTHRHYKRGLLDKGVIDVTFNNR